MSTADRDQSMYDAVIRIDQTLRGPGGIVERINTIEGRLGNLHDVRDRLGAVEAKVVEIEKRQQLADKEDARRVGWLMGAAAAVAFLITAAGHAIYDAIFGKGTPHSP